MKARSCFSCAITFFAAAFSSIASAQTASTLSSPGAATIARPSWATPDRLRGRVDPTSSITIQVHLPLRDLAGAKAELEAVSDPASPRYGQYLSSEQFESRYSPTIEDMTTVQSYLQSEGFKTAYAPRNRLFVSATAKVSDVERVFATHLGQYEVEKGQLRRAPIEAATIPGTLVSRASGVLGLHSSVARRTAIGGRAQTSMTATAPTCSDYFGEYFDTIDPPYGGGFPNPTPLHPCSYAPPRLRKAYGFESAVANGNDGRGVNVAVVDAWRSPTLTPDAQAFAAQFDPAHPLYDSQITLIDAPSGGDPNIPLDPNWYYEQLGDVEILHSIAPGAHIVYVGAATNGNEDLVAAENLNTTS
jgi:subtilase family serine protease